MISKPLTSYRLSSLHHVANLCLTAIDLNHAFLDVLICLSSATETAVADALIQFVCSVTTDS